MLYFYEKQEALLQCEVRNTEVPDTYAIVITEVDGRVRTHYINGANAAHRLWLAIEQQLRATGWTGPVGELGPGRDGRSCTLLQKAAAKFPA